MMKTIRREFSGEADIRVMAALAHDFPADNLHVADLPYRFSSWAFDYPDNIGLWVNAEGQLLAWAVMQTPFWAVDYACHPDSDRNLHRQLLAWADSRARQVLDTPSGRPMWFVNVFAGQTDRIRDLEEAGFVSQANVGDDSWAKVLMRRSARIPVADCALPAGFTIRPLAGESEIEAYVELHRAAFESRNMTAEWRTRTLRHPDYVPDLDLVAVAPDGRLAAFCVCWLNKNSGQVSGQIEPLGVHADFRKLGLGRVILSEGLRRLHLHGASRIYVETDSYRNAALELYESVGFEVIQDVLVYRKDYV
jgi:ribosomal protein S18 acetylase RimI-like enzyme